MKNTLLFTLAAVFISAMMSTNLFAADTPTVEQKEVLAVIAAPQAAKVLILDVRSKEEYDAGHIQGAVNISHNEISEKYASIEAFKNEKVIVYCRSGRRAGIAEEILMKKGFSKVHHLSGDMNGWKDANLPTVAK